MASNICPCFWWNVVPSTGRSRQELTWTQWLQGLKQKYISGADGWRWKQVPVRCVFCPSKKVTKDHQTSRWVSLVDKPIPIKGTFWEVTGLVYRDVHDFPWRLVAGSRLHLLLRLGPPALRKSLAGAALASSDRHVEMSWDFGEIFPSPHWGVLRGVKGQG